MKATSVTRESGNGIDASLRANIIVWDLVDIVYKWQKGRLTMLFSKRNEVSREVCKKIGGGDWE